MPRDAISINALLWRTFTPAIVVVAIALAALVYSRLYDTILDGFDRKLVTTSALTGALIDPSDHDRLISTWMPGVDPVLMEETQAYRRNVLPMRRIKKDLGLTYLYSQVIGGSKDIWYVLDANQGDDHSQIGSEDVMTPETLAGLKAATARGTVYVSPIEFQVQWGLLKTAAAPIRSQNEEITATVGADVNISVIQVASQNALFASALIGVASLMACALVTLMIMRRVARPIARLKADALRIAAGDRAPPAPITSPREAARLRDALGTLAEDLMGTMRAARAGSVADDRARNLEQLTAALSDNAAPLAVLVDNPAVLAVWIGIEGEGPEPGLARRGMTLLAGRIAAEPALAKDWAALVGGQSGTTLVFDRKSRTVSLTGERAVDLWIDGVPTALAPGARLSLAPGAMVEAATPGGPAPLAWEAPA